MHALYFQMTWKHSFGRHVQLVPPFQHIIRAHQTIMAFHTNSFPKPLFFYLINELILCFVCSGKLHRLGLLFGFLLYPIQFRVKHQIVLINTSDLRWQPATERQNNAMKEGLSCGDPADIVLYENQRSAPNKTISFSFLCLRTVALHEDGI